MKFQCDSCDTRYSISDDRVRGKILKIRCKNCGNIIQVRDPLLGQEMAPTADAPASERASSEQLTNPPAEQEWFMSADGEQAGPFGTAAAREWLKQQDPSMELFCWTEGFAEWLPYDEVKDFADLELAPKDALRQQQSGGGAFVSASAPPTEDEGDLFEVGEVSRVVKLPQLAAMQGGQAAAPRRTMLPFDPGASAEISQDDLVAHDVSSQRRGGLRGAVVIGIIGAATIVGVGVAILKIRGNANTTPTYSQNMRYQDNLGEYIVRDGVRVYLNNKSSTSSRSKVSRPRSSSSRTAASTSVGIINSSAAPTGEITPGDILRRSSRANSSFKRCYERAQKRDPYLRVKKMKITLTVAKSGKVTKTKLSSHANHQLGKCLSSRVKAWKFKPNTNGITSQISVLFQNS